MGTATLLATAAGRGAFTARYLHHGDDPDTLIPLLRRMWVRTFDRDAAAMAAALLIRDWTHLNTDPQPQPRSALFVTETDPDAVLTPPMTVCTVCGAVDEITHQELPSMVGYGHDTCKARLRCGSSVATDPMFGAHVTRKPWPPAPAP